jgi:hypothetical protein
VFQLHGLDDAEKCRAGAARRDLGFRLEPQVADYLLNHTRATCRACCDAGRAGPFKPGNAAPITLPLLRQLLLNQPDSALRLLLGDVLVDLRHVQPITCSIQRIQRVAGSEPASDKDDLLAEHHQRGDGADLEIAGQFLFDFGIDLGENVVGVLLGRGFENRRRTTAGAAPGCQKSTMTTSLLVDGGFEVVLGEFDDGHAGSCSSETCQAQK